MTAMEKMISFSIVPGTGQRGLPDRTETELSPAFIRSATMDQHRLMESPGTTYCPLTTKCFHSITTAMEGMTSSFTVPGVERRGSPDRTEMELSPAFIRSATMDRHRPMESLDMIYC